MYYYIYDASLNDKKYSSSIHRIENRLMQLGISGRIEKLSLLKSFKETVEDAVKKGAATVVAVGNDSTVSKIISVLPSLNITFGIIPVGPNNQIARILGIPEGEQACDVLSARITEKIDLGKANQSYFIGSLAIPQSKDIIVDCGDYNISASSNHSSLNIYNINTTEKSEYGENQRYGSNPKDGLLEVVFESPKQSHGLRNFFKKEYSTKSIFPLKKLKIKCSANSLPVIVDGQVTFKTPVTVEVAPKKLKVIVGKNRMF